MNVYQSQFGEAAVKEIGKWLVSTLTWLPLFVSGLGLYFYVYSFELLFLLDHPNFLRRSGTLLLAWFLTGKFGDLGEKAKNKTELVENLVVFSSAFFSAFFLAFISLEGTIISLEGTARIEPSLLLVAVALGYALLIPTGIAIVVGRNLAISIATGVGVSVIVLGLLLVLQGRWCGGVACGSSRDVWDRKSRREKY